MAFWEDRLLNSPYATTSVRPNRNRQKTTRRKDDFVFNESSSPSSSAVKPSNRTSEKPWRQGSQRPASRSRSGLSPVNLRKSSRYETNLFRDILLSPEDLLSRNAADQDFDENSTDFEENSYSSAYSEDLSCSQSSITDDHSGDSVNDEEISIASQSTLDSDYAASFDDDKVFSLIALKSKKRQGFDEEQSFKISSHNNLPGESVKLPRVEDS